MHRFEQQDVFAGNESPVESLVVDDTQMRQLENIGIIYKPDFISQQEEIELLKEIDATPWLTDLRRRVQHYGFRYDYKKRAVSESDRIEPLPPWVKPLAERLQDVNYLGAMPDQLIINEYQPGQGIAPHIDRDCFGNRIAAVSLSGDCLLRLHAPDSGDEKDFIEVAVRHRSLMVYTGEGRAKWRHSIAARKSDKQNGKEIKRTRRISLTFRTVSFE